MSDCAVLNKYNFINQDCGCYHECDECDGSGRVLSHGEWLLLGTLRGGK